MPCCPLGSISLWLVSGELGFLELLTRELGALTRNTFLVAICPFSPGLGFKVPSLFLTPWPPSPVPRTPLLSPSPSNPNPLLSPPSYPFFRFHQFLEPDSQPCAALWFPVTALSHHCPTPWGARQPGYLLSSARIPLSCRVSSSETSAHRVPTEFLLDRLLCTCTRPFTS